MNATMRGIRAVLSMVLVAATAGATQIPGVDFEADWTFETNGEGDEIGTKVASAGDINGDGFEDIITGTQGFNSGAGRALVFHGSATGLSAAPDWIVDGIAMSRLGQAVSGVGDVNGDGFDDVLVAAPGYSNSPTTLQEGAVFLWLGSAQGLRRASPSSPMAGAPDWNAQGNAPNRWLGHAFCGAIDVNGDGFADIVVGAPGGSMPGQPPGEVRIYPGGGTGGLPSTPPAVLTAPMTPSGPAEGFARSVVRAGNVNGDLNPDTQQPLDDVLVSATNADDGGLFLYTGSPEGLGTTPHWTLDEETGILNMGETYSSAGDFNGDGVDDIAILAFVGSPATLEIWIIHGIPAGGGMMATTPQTVIRVVNETAVLGTALVPAGDVDGDGFDDLLVGCLSYHNGDASSDVVLLFRGGPAGVVETYAWGCSTNAYAASFGTTVAAVDVNGTGTVDVIVGARDYHTNSAEEREGKLFAFHEALGPPPLPTQLGQFRLDGTTPIPTGGTTTDVGVVVGATIADTEESAGEVRLEVELKPLGQAFSGEPGDIVAGNFQPGGSPAQVPVSGLQSGQAYHWRVRTARPAGSASAWVSFGGNPETVADFSVPPNTAPPLPSVAVMAADGGGPLQPGTRIFNPGAIVLTSGDADPDGNPLRLEIEVRSGGASLTGVPTSSGAVASPGHAASATIALPDGTYAIQARLKDPWEPGPWAPLGTFTLIAAGSANTGAGCAATGDSGLPILLFVVLSALPRRRS